MPKVFKTSSAGNTFLHIARTDFETEETHCPITTICSKDKGLAADGLVVFEEGEQTVDFRIFNADGSEAEISGNGLAGLATLLAIKNKQNSFRFITAIGERKVKTQRISASTCFCSVEIASADFSNKKFFPSIKSHFSALSYRSLQFYPVVVGNPHIVTLLKEFPTEQEMSDIFQSAQSDPQNFPQRTNLEFVVFNGDSAEVRFFERGVGQTFASSTGSAAVFAVLNKIYQLSTLRIKTHGGQDITVSLSEQEMISVSIESELLFLAELKFFPTK